jgi:hypothetical protein
MEKKGFDELKQLFEKKQNKEKNNSSSKNKKKENKKDKKKQEKIKKEKNKQEDIPQRTLTLENDEIESVRKSLIKNINPNDKNVKFNNKNDNKETLNELDIIKNKLVKANTIIIGNTNIKNTKTEENGGVNNIIENLNLSVNDNKANKKKINNAKNIISNINQDTNKDKCNNEKKETKNGKNNITNIKNTENKKNLSSYLDSFVKSKSFIPLIKDNNKMEIKSFKTNNKVINENENKVFEKSFDKLVNLQVLLKKESSLKELCKYLL